MYSLRIDPSKRLKSWVAEITGKCPTYGFARTFLPAKYDYAGKYKRSQEVPKIYELEPGKLYEVYSPIRRAVDRYFCRVTTKDELIRLPLSEVDAAVRLSELEDSITGGQ